VEEALVGLRVSRGDQTAGLKEAARDTFPETELPWFGPSGASFIPATHPHRCRVEWRSRPAHLGRRRLGLDGREHGSALDWHGAKQACQHRPSNDVADAPSMCVIVLRRSAHMDACRPYVVEFEPRQSVRSWRRVLVFSYEERRLN
jgi:hypothetical protein